METNDVLLLTLAAVLMSLASFALEALEKALEQRGWPRLAKLIGAIRAYLPADAAGAKERGLKLIVPFIFVLAIGTSACEHPLQPAVTAANVALELGKTSAEEIEKRCTKPLMLLAAKRAVATEDGEKSKITEEAAKINEVCRPLVESHDALRRAHHALVIVLVAGLAGQNVASTVPALLSELAKAVAQIDKK